MRTDPPPGIQSVNGIQKYKVFSDDAERMQSLLQGLPWHELKPSRSWHVWAALMPLMCTPSGWEYDKDEVAERLA